VFGSVPQGESGEAFFYNISALDPSTTPFALYYQRPLINKILKFSKFRSYYYWCLEAATKLLESQEFHSHAQDLQLRVAHAIDEGNRTMSIWKTGSFYESLTTTGKIIPTGRALNGVDVFGIFPFNKKWAANITAQLKEKAPYDIPVITRVYVSPVANGPKSLPAYLYAHVEHSLSAKIITADAHLTIFEPFGAETIPWSQTFSVQMQWVSRLGLTNYYELNLATIGESWTYIAYSVNVTVIPGYDSVVFPSDYPKTWGLVTRY